VPNQGQVDFEALLHGGIRKPLRPPSRLAA
jgi:hypothetical protein